MYYLLLIAIVTLLQLNSGLSQELNSVTLSTNDENCPPWFFYNSTIGLCQCFESLNIDVRCTNEGALLRFGRCMTYQDEENVTLVGFCPYFHVDNFIDNITQGLFFNLPKNVSELNDYMCTPLNRKGYQCNECFEGYGISMTSLSYQCSDCDGVWYGIPLYLVVEFIPITIFYILILVYRWNVTTAPMTSYIMFSQFAFYGFIFSADSRNVAQSQLPSGLFNFFNIVVVGFYGVWNLNFFRQALFPFCVSPDLKLIHVFFLDYISAIYPLCLIAFTWLWIELSSRGFKPIICISKNTRRCSTQFKLNWDKKNTIVDVFATFLLLSYSKLLFQSLAIFGPSTTQVAYSSGDLSQILTSVDVGIDYFGNNHLPFAIIAILIFIFFVILPALILALYPFKVFRTLLTKLRLLGSHKAAFHLFVEKFYSCYRTSLDGGRDMRSFASLYFFLRFLLVFVHQADLELAGLSGPDIDDAQVITILLRALLVGSVTILLATVRPYKEAYMNILDTLILSMMTLLTLFPLLYLFSISNVDSKIGLFLLYASILAKCMPQLGLLLYLIINLWQRKKPLKWLQDKISNLKKKRESEMLNAEGVTDQITEESLPDQLLHPELYYIEAENAL